MVGSVSARSNNNFCDKEINRVRIGSLSPKLKPKRMENFECALLLFLFRFLLSTMGTAMHILTCDKGLNLHRYNKN